ncbi:DUF6020 family protein [Clostridium neonatale]|uniref:DUF6020 family protein n=1 Tax=Clostridium neonatale TaxID=137838 RepID=UPI003D32C798
MIKEYVISKKKFNSLILSLLCIFMLSLKNSNGKSMIINSSSGSSIFYLIVFYYLFLKSIEFYNENSIKFEIILAFIFACSVSVGKELLDYGTIMFKYKNLYFNIFGLTLLFFAILVSFINYLPTIHNNLYNFKLNKFTNKLFELNEKQIFWITFLLFMICWLPAFLALYPGYLSYDGPGQIADYFVRNKLNAWHPIVHTMTLVWCFKIGNFIFGNYAAGLTLHCLIQAIISALVLAYLVISMIRWKLPKILVILSILFLGFNPIIQVFVFTTTKDVIFGALFLLVILYTMDIVYNSNQFFSSNFYIIRYVLSVIIMSLFRKQGIFVFIFFVPIFIYVAKVYWKKAVIISLISISFVFAFFGPISDSLGIIPGPISETLSVPLQQIARVMNINPDSLTTEEKKEVYNYLSEETLKKYIPEISDPIKADFNLDEFNKNKIEFFKLYLNIGMKNLGIYIDSFLYGNLGYFYPSTEGINQWGYLMYYHSPLEININQNSLFPLYLKYLMIAGNDLFRSIPILSFFVAQYCPFWIFMIVLMILLKQKKYDLLIPLSFTILYWLSLLLGPVCCIRYAYPLLISVPLIISFPFINCNRKD